MCLQGHERTGYHGYKTTITIWLFTLTVFEMGKALIRKISQKLKHSYKRVHNKGSCKFVLIFNKIILIHSSWINNFSTDTGFCFGNAWNLARIGTYVRQFYLTDSKTFVNNVYAFHKTKLYYRYRFYIWTHKCEKNINKFALVNVAGYLSFTFIIEL